MQPAWLHTKTWLFQKLLFDKTLNGQMEDAGVDVARLLVSFSRRRFFVCVSSRVVLNGMEEASPATTSSLAFAKKLWRQSRCRHDYYLGILFLSFYSIFILIGF